MVNLTVCPHQHHPLTGVGQCPDEGHGHLNRLRWSRIEPVKMFKQSSTKAAEIIKLVEPQRLGEYIHPKLVRVAVAEVNYTPSHVLLDLAQLPRRPLVMPPDGGIALGEFGCVLLPLSFMLVVR